MSPENGVRRWLESQAAARPHADYAIAPETGRRLTFAALLDASRALAAWLQAQGMAPGAHVAWLLPNGLQAIRLLVGTMAAGHVATPLSLIAQAAQLAYVLEHSDCQAVFVSPELETKLREALARVGRAIRVFVVDPDAGEIAGEAPAPDWPAAPPESADPALLMYTSGTTGRPKGVLLSQGNVAAGARFVSESHGLGAADRVLAVLPLYHINAQVVTVLAPLCHGGSLVMPRRFSAALFWSQAVEGGCTWLNVVPTIVSYLLAGEAPGLDLSRLKFCRSASAPLPPEQQRAFEARFGIGIIETMGLTETAAPVFANPLEAARRKPGSPGQAWGCAARVVDPASCEELPAGLPGEIQIRGPNVTSGYYKAPDETARAFAPGGWLRTGDLGYRDPDGFFFITGRIKELIIKGGENIAPREIDEALLVHPAVLEAAAVGIPDPHYGQEIAAAVVLRPGAACEEAWLLDFCRRELGAFKAPKRVLFLEELPKGPSGKVQRLRLLDILK